MMIASPLILGPDERSCEQLRAEMISMAEEANHKAAEAFLAGHMAQGAAYLEMADRLTLLAGGKS